MSVIHRTDVNSKKASKFGKGLMILKAAYITDFCKSTGSINLANPFNRS
nr:hypothetical protein [Desulfoscipio gibsoniae]